MDEMVLNVQKWVNQTYEGRSGFKPAREDGRPAWSTVYALTRALQIELGISQPVDSFGPGTTAAYKQYGELELGNAPTDSKGKRIVKIFQGACFIKGYHPGSFDGNFTEYTKQAVIDLQTDAGLPVKDGKVYDYIFKAFLVMDAYTLTGTDGDPKIRSIQQDLNNRYYKTAGVCPCDGHYQRNTNKALIYGIQTEQGIASDQQTGSVGPSTRELLPTIGVGNAGIFVRLFQYALYFNGYDVGALDGIYGEGMKQTVIEFQEFTALDADGIVGKQAWLSALISTGDPSRKGTACDCVTEITPARAQTLIDEGYETVGRYLVNVEGGLNKKIQPGELDTIFDAGLTVFPIYQTIGNEVSYFTFEQGKSDGQAAYNAAREFGFKEGTIIYFAVDFDALGDQINSNILSYFQGVNEGITFYQVGVYGPRNVGITVSNNGLATTSFVSGMSTGFSGNLGYPLPDNWAFDQIATISVGSGDGYISIDNNIKSGRDNGSSSVDEGATNPNEESLEQLGTISLLALQFASTTNANDEISLANALVTQYYRKGSYEGTFWGTIAGGINQDFVEMVDENPNVDAELIEFIDPATGLENDIQHLMATMGAEVFNPIPLFRDRINDFAGWAGDLITVIKDVVEHVDEYDGDWYECAKDYIGTSSKKSNFEFDDLIADIDAMILGNKLRENPDSSVYNEFVNYYQSNQPYNRFSTIYELRFYGDPQILKAQAEMYLNAVGPDVAAMREFFHSQFGVPEYTTEQGREVARAFADVILDFIEHE
ncbi:glycoside hydrolase domain-containing protein [Oceanobacillus oncorhynchi]|uniref:glycoside hydrolase domain-containing protein n=1 Tax=Oceanobacillus oncorhynchi TaxID=545501 RepID=UPI0018674181|nr:glycoside hydrolase domain-containing protein [Oceanobacillus oncorhynchi]